MNVRSPLQAQAYANLKDWILSGRLDANTLYSETRMAAEMGISRTPMREALQCLSQDGYITVIPSKGFMIRQLNEKDMVESIQIRCAIEGFCTHIIAGEIQTRKGQKLLRDLKKLLDQQEKSMTCDDGHKAFMECDHKFHLTLVNYVNNQEFNHTFQRLMYLIHLTTATALSIPGRVEDTMIEHKQYFAYLQSGQGDEAYRLLVRHLMMPLNMKIVDR